MTQTAVRILTSDTARTLAGKLISRLALAVALAFLAAVLPGAVHAAVEHGLWAGVQMIPTQAYSLFEGLWETVTSR
jgi:hypothetical protein